MIKLCIFDMDGTVVNTLDSIAYFANNALNKYGLASLPCDKYKLFLGNGARVLVERMIKETGGTPEQFEKVLKYYNKTYDSNFLYLTRAYDGICDMLKNIKGMGIKNAILSNKPDGTAKKVSDALFSSALVDICLGARDNVPLKPDPSAVFEIIKLFNVKKEQCIYIGDTATDIKTAKSAGLVSVGVLWGFRDKKELSDAGADFLVGSPHEITDIIKNMNK